MAVTSPSSSDAPVALSQSELDSLNERFAAAHPTEIVRWLADYVGAGNITVAVAMTSDTVLVDVASKAVPGVEVVFLDTGYHFNETLQTVDNVKRRYPIELRIMPAPPVDAGEPWVTDPNGCCDLRKVQPLEAALAGKTGWVSGVRRSDSAVRADIPFVQIDRRGLIKINPLAAWDDDELATYAMLHDVPMNPLLDQGYPSIGCVPCTRKPSDDEHHRAGRWSGHAKTECGLHL